MTAPVAPVRQDTGNVDLRDPPKILSGDEWAAAQYAPHRVGQDPTKPMGPGRILTGDEWEKAQSSGLGALKIPAMPKFAADATQRLNPNAGPVDRSIPEQLGGGVRKIAEGFDTAALGLDPTSAAAAHVAAALGRQAVAPVVEHPLLTAALANPPGAVIGAGMAVTTIAQYGWQKAHELQMSPEDRAKAEADPNRVSGEAAAVQAVMLGLGGLAGVKAVQHATDFGAGMMEAGAASLRPLVESPKGAEVLGAAAATHGLPETASPYPPASPQDAAWKQGHATTEKLTGVAIRNAETGQVYSQTGFEGGHPALTERVANEIGTSPLMIDLDHESGFMTSTGRYVSRAEAMQIAREGRNISQDAQNTARAKSFGLFAEDVNPPASAEPTGAPSSTAEPPTFEEPTPAPKPVEPITGKTVRSVPIRDENGVLRRDLSRVAAEDLQAEWRRLAEQNNAEEAAYRAVLEAPYRANYEALPSMEKTGRSRRQFDEFGNKVKRQAEDLPDAGGTIDPEQLAADNKIVKEYESSRAKMARDARDRAMMRIEGEMAKRPAEDFNAAADAYHAGTPGQRPLAPIEGTGPTRTRGLATSVEQRAVANELTDYLGDLPEYRQVNMADQAAQATDLLASDPERARRIALGDEAAPQGLIPEAVFKAVERQAIHEGDVGTLRDLASGGLTTEATTMGQRLRALAERDPESPVAAMQQVEDARARHIGDVEEATAKIIADIEKTVKKANGNRASMLNQLAEFVDAMRC